MATGVRIDPLPAFNFVVQLIESGGVLRTVASFRECSGLDSTLEVEEYKEGGVNDRTHKLATRFSFANITLKRGITPDGMLRQWHLDLLRGKTSRRDGLIILMNEARNPVLAWKFERGLPVKWTGPALNATQNEISVETLEIAHEHLEPYDLGV